MLNIGFRLKTLLFLPHNSTLVKRSRFQLALLIVTVVCLITLVGIQIAWILKQAKMQEAQFNHSVGMALKRIENNLEKYSSCAEPYKCTSCKLLTSTLKQVTNLDSIIKSDLNYYGINLDFDYGIIDLKHEKGVSSKSTYITKNLAEKLHQSGYELKINFPKKRDFIIAQIGLIFISSIVLVILVSVSFLLIYRFYRREKLLTEQIRDFVNNMTHEFKTPLTNIGFANSMLAKSEAIESNQKLSSYTSIIRSEHYRLKERVEELLKASQSKTIINSCTEEIDLYKATEDVIETFKPQVEEKHGKINLNSNGDNFTIDANIDQLNIIIGNLLDNAIKYSNKSPIIEIKLKSLPSKVTFDITDNGIGIHSKHLARIFDNFYRVPQGDIHDCKGFGLGLYHVKNLVNNINGKISVTSVEEKGSTFSIEFKRKKP